MELHHSESGFSLSTMHYVYVFALLYAVTALGAIFVWALLETFYWIVFGDKDDE